MTVAQADTSQATVLVEQIHALLDELAATDVSACAQVVDSQKLLTTASSRCMTNPPAFHGQILGSRL